MATHKVQQLDINLSRISDEGTRDAFLSVIRFVNEMTQGIRTNKDVKAERLVNQDETAGFSKDGKLFAKSLELAQGGEFKVMVIQDELAALGIRTIQLADGVRILGAFGWTQYNGSSDWEVLVPFSISTPNTIFISGTSLNSIELTNGDGGDANKFNLVILYADR